MDRVVGLDNMLLGRVKWDWERRVGGVGVGREGGIIAGGAKSSRESRLSRVQGSMQAGRQLQQLKKSVYSL